MTELVDGVGLAMLAEPTLGPDGTPWLLLVAKATFTLPLEGGEVRRHAAALPIVEADEFEGEPGVTPTARESDLVPLKPRCDVLLSGSAHAPEGRAAASVAVGLRVGAMRKSFRVCGRRRWRRARREMVLGAPEPFRRQPIGYGSAYGGIEARDPDPAHHAARLPNPVGVGFHADPRLDAGIDGSLAPSQEPLDAGPRDPWTQLPALAFGPVGRSWQPRLARAGTFDAAWQRERSPFLPVDFDPLHWQAAPDDQQVETLDGGVAVELWNLSRRPHVAFVLPRAALVARAEGAVRGAERPMRLDTLLLEPDQGRFSLVWRTHWSLRERGAGVDRIAVRPQGTWPRALRATSRPAGVGRGT